MTDHVTQSLFALWMAERDAETAAGIDFKYWRYAFLVPRHMHTHMLMQMAAEQAHYRATDGDDLEEVLMKSLPETKGPDEITIYGHPVIECDSVTEPKLILMRQDLKHEA